MRWTDCFSGVVAKNSFSVSALMLTNRSTAIESRATLAAGVLGAPGAAACNGANIVGGQMTEKAGLSSNFSAVSLSHG
jgi:hypothetical protein